ncbi:hypothetical protein [Paracoccus sp. SSJ]|uniref:hypothetical protein n=1 Tax=Paracoccus sp. SSJ TaxID=3050636 RepID=UPI00254A12E5|nr:hypothetical protein [Paracoccus sp. SSJ]MDK8874402.1 hypothetical protein [Paracoccus sp. SSJ]
MADEVLNDAAPEAVQSDTLVEQPDAPRAQEVKPQAEEPKPEPKAKNPTEARADAVKKAIDKATKEPDPEPKAEEKPEPKEPAAERAPDGKFTARKVEGGDDLDEPAKPKVTAYKDAPQRFDDAAKAEWETVPESVRGAVHRTIKENEQGIEKYRAAAESYEPLRQFDEMAKASGNTLVGAVQKMVEIEAAFARNPVEGFMRVGQALGIDVRAVAAQIAGQTPQQVNDHAVRMQMADMQRQNAQLQQQLVQQQQAAQLQQQQAAALTEWQQFQAANPQAAEMEAEMADFLRKYPASEGVSLRDRLEDAFAFAAAKHPKAAHTGDDPALAQTQAPRTANPAGQKSITGAARDEASSPKQKRSRSEAIKQAMRAHGAL